MKNLLVVVDYQNDFVSGSLGFPGAELLEAPIAERIALYQQRGDEVVFTQDTHTPDYLFTQEGKLLPVSHCIRSSHGWQLTDMLEPLSAGCKRFEKDTFGCAGLFNFLQRQPYASIELCGLVSSICVVSNAILVKTAQPEATVLIDARLTGAPNRELHEKTLDVLENLQVHVSGRASQ